LQRDCPQSRAFFVWPGNCCNDLGSIDPGGKSLLLV
jgi:hypothetical protein